MEGVLMRQKVLFVASEFAPGMIPFAATVINTLAEDERFEVHAICVNSGKYGYNGLISKNANPKFVDYPQNKVSKLIYKFWPFHIINAIEKARKTLKPDVVHFLTGDFTLASYVILKHDDTFYYTVHDLHPHEVKTSSLLDAIIFKDIIWGYRKCRESISNLTTSSWSQLMELQKIYQGKKCKYTSFPTLVTQEIQNGKKVPIELNGIDDYILFFGSVNEYKGVNLLIEAFEKSKLSDITKLVIAGKGLDYNIHSKNVIRLNRFVDDDEVASLFERACIVVYPYISATMSGVLSIAYYFNKLILASDIPFFKDNATESVTFFKAGDVEDLQLRMENMMTYRESYQLDKTSYSRIYSALALADSYWNLYNDEI